MQDGMSFESNVLNYEGKVSQIVGVVKRVEIKEEYIAVTVKVMQCGNIEVASWQKKENALIRLNITQDEETATLAYDLVGRNISAIGMITEPVGRRNPGCFNYQLYLKTKNIYSICDVSRYKFQIGNIQNNFLHFLSVKKGEFFERAKAIMSQDSFALLAGLLFGEKSYLQGETYEEFQKNGLAHILAVSGLHVGLVYAAFVRLFAGRNNFKISIVTLLVILSYSALSNFAVSVMRAAGMIALAIIARHLKQRYDLVTAASVIAIIFLFYNPYQLFDSGFQLSFLAAYSIGVILPYFNLKFLELSDKLKREWIYSLSNIMSPCIVVQLCMAPMVVFSFLTISPIGLIMNPPAVALTGLLLPTGLLMFLTSLFMGPSIIGGQSGIMLSEYIFAGITSVAQALLECLTQLSQLGAKIGGSSASIAPPIAMIILIYSLLFFFFSEIRFIMSRKKKKRFVAILTIFLIVFACIFPVLMGFSPTVLPWKYDTPLLTFLDVGQGESLHIRTQDSNIIIDGGGNFYTDIGKTVLQPYFLKNGINHLDLAIVSHADMDHFKGIAQLSKIMTIDMLLVSKVYENAIASYSEIDCANVSYISAGDIITLSDDAFLSVLAPGKFSVLSDMENANSLILLLNYKGLRILLTADMENTWESKLLSVASCDILKISHHGSDYSTGPDFVVAATPSFAVISCGRNNIYGHPSPRVIELLENSGIITGRTDLWGAICLRSISKNFLVFQNASKEITWTIPRKETQ